MKVAWVMMWYHFAYAQYEHSWEPRSSLPGQCGPQEFYNECGSSCKTDCYTAQIIVHCINKRCLEGCFCKGGFLRSGKDAQCVKEDHCPIFRQVMSKFAQKELQLEKLISEMLFDS